MTSFSARALVACLSALGASACANHSLIHPAAPPPQVVNWSSDFRRQELAVHIEGARPPGPGPFPTVLVHAEEDATAADMHGVLWDLASRGYLAVAADYQRLIDGKYQDNPFAWRSIPDIETIVDILKDYPEIDQLRIGALGFSQGAVLSLLIAAHAPERIKAVVSYYPVTDFPHWFAAERRNPLRRWMIGMFHRQLRSVSGAADDAEFERMLRLASPYYVAELIRAPVLLIHGAADKRNPLDESERMADELEAHGKTVELLVVPGAKNLFNFRDREQAKIAWDATLAWLERYLGRPGDVRARAPAK